MVSSGGFTLGAGLLAATAGPADVVFASSSPLTIRISGVLASRLRRTPFVFELQGLWPAGPIGLGFLTGRPGVRGAGGPGAGPPPAAQPEAASSPEGRHAPPGRGVPPGE